MPAGPSTKKSTARGRSPESTPAGATPRDDDQRLAATGAEATAEVPAREDEPVATVPSGAEPGVEPEATAEAKPKAKRKPRGRARTKLGPEISLPVLVVDETALLPHMSIPFPIEDDESAMVIDRAMRTPSRLVLVLTERPVPPVSAAGDEGGPDPIRDGEFRELVADAVAETLAETLGVTLDAADRAEAELADSEDPAWTPDEAQPVEEYELAPVGVIAEVGQRIARPGGGHAHVILQGQARGVVTKILQEQPYVAARVRRQDDPVDAGTEGEAAMSAVLEQVETYISMLPNVPEEVLTMIRGVDEPGWLADLIAFSPEFSSEQRQELLEILDPVKRLRRLSVIVQKRLNVLNLRRQIQHEAQAGMDKQQREYFLREQMRAIQKELGDGSAEETLANELRQKIEAAGMPDLVKEKALIQVERLEQQHPFSPEIGVIRSYLEWLTELPWAIETADRLDLNEAAAILDRDHHGLEKVKERIIEYIAVRKLAGDKLRAPIICFVGPPGVGKTSLGRSIAEAIGRNYVRMSLGGVRDEAEIRGHRRTYVGAMPGRVVKSLRDAKSRNPVMVLDEIDKIGTDAFRGDPASALLEVLDPEQNNAFSDHYLEVPFDLSKVIFITTANMLEPIPPALRDRMEVIEVSGYTEIEKLAIARDFLLPKSLDSHGLTPEQLTVTDAALRTVIREYTSESGVRNLERELGALARKAARQFAGDDPPESKTIDAVDLVTYLGVPRYEFGLAEERDEVG
ncbi:MAG: endopeptidase La, partial [Chloroflexia bacterium]|nr:endopeptidase La [Chloroflexia bacterium]